MTTRKTVKRINVWACRCERCGHEWESVGDVAPPRCASCKRRNWNLPAGTLKPGPRPKKK